MACLEASNFGRVVLCSRRAETCEEILEFRTNHLYTGDYRMPANVVATTSVNEAVDGASWIVVAVPSDAAREVFGRLLGEVNQGTPVVIATKGIERGTGLFTIEVFQQVAGLMGRRPAHEPLVLSGPNLAALIREGRPAVSVLACNQPGPLRRGVRELSHPLLSLIGHQDPEGVQVAGALKNVYAVACGMSQALGWGANATAAILCKGLTETMRFADAMGADPQSVLTPAGVGDFHATCTSPLSRNHDLGRLLAGERGEEVTGVREGARSAQGALQRSRSLGLRLSLLEAICLVMQGFLDPRAILRAALAANADSGLEPSTLHARPSAGWLPPDLDAGLGVAGK